jgi:hypothetical protein
MPPQVYDADYLNGGVKFKVEGMAQEIEKSGEVRYGTYKTWETLFNAPEPLKVSGH